MQDETNDNPIPNSIYNNSSGFSHDYYSGLTATADQPTRCLGITPAAWASGKPTTQDSTPPTERMTAPVEGSFHRGPSILLSADAVDTGGISRVEFYGWSVASWSNQAWISLGADTTAPDELDWDINSSGDGGVFVSVDIYDNAGNHSGLIWEPDWVSFYVDITPPTSSVNSLASSQSEAQFTVSWRGIDNFGNSSNTLTYDIELQENGGTWTEWLLNTPSTTSTFTGAPGHTYGFRSRVRDSAGNVEDWPPTADATTTINLSLATATSTTTSTTVPSNPGTGTGLTGEYFDDANFTRPVMTRVDSTINFMWDNDSPAPAIGVDTFSVRWSGYVEPASSGSYTFSTYTDDGVRLWVNEQQFIDNWTNHGPTENSGTIALVAGQRYTIRLEYYENTVFSIMRLYWSSSNQWRERRRPPGIPHGSH